MSNPLELSLSDSFNRERFSRAIDETSDVKQLREIAKLLLGSWLSQKTATKWVLDQALSRPATVSPEAIGFSTPVNE